MMRGEPILYLDFDGVLNSIDFIMSRPKGSTGTWPIDPATIPRLHRILDKTGAVIVVSSSWRIGSSKEELNQQLWDAGMPKGYPIEGLTPILGGNRIRGDEIRAYKWWRADMTRAFVCLDDDSDFYPDQNLVQTNVQHGLTDEIADKVIERFMTQASDEVGHD